MERKKMKKEERGFKEWGLMYASSRKKHNYMVKAEPRGKIPLSINSIVLYFHIFRQY